MKCDSRASLLARTFTNPCLGREPKAKLATCWEYLENECEVKFGFRKLILLKGIDSFKKEENESMKRFFKGNKKTLYQLEGIKFTILKEFVIPFIFNSFLD
jgi:hypothetical protein